MVHEKLAVPQSTHFFGQGETQLAEPERLVHLVPALSITKKSPLTTTLENHSGAAPAEVPGGRPYLLPWQAAAQEKGRFGYFLAKRCLDCTLALIAIVALSPILLLMALLVRLTSRGPAIFRQERVGLGGRRFVMYKFRSMYMESDETLHRVAYEQFLRGERSHGKVDGVLPADGTLADGKPFHKTTAPWAKLKRNNSGDPRVTLVGNFLRRSSLDELPQLFNVLFGDMSLVGPRPPIPYEVALYQPWHLGRLDTLPGITGIWQVYGRSRVTFDQMVQMDLEYIQKQSLWYDLKLLLLTVPAVLNRRGAY